MRFVLLLGFFLSASAALAQQPLTLDYELHVDSAAANTFAVRMVIRNAPARFTIAAHAHPEYDDKYWRYIEGLSASGGTLTRPDSVRWTVDATQRVVTLEYRLRPPLADAPRAAWRAFLTSSGGVVGGPHSFLYVVGAEDAAAEVRVVLPAGWLAASALERDAAGTFRARDVFTLMESPILVGRLRHWSFDVARTPHAVYFLPGANPIAFDTAAFLDGVKRLVQENIALFDQVPYDRYVFMFVDDAYGGLEHPNSATLGVQASQLATDPHAPMPEIAHEFFHTWNLMRIKPIEYRRVDYRVQPPVSGLWFSEGLSIFYADLLQRRAGFRLSDSTRIVHLERLLMRYANDPAFERFSPEEISRAEYNTEPGALGNYDPSSHVVGEVIGAMLDLLIRAATDGNRSMDDVMRLLNERHAERGFTGADIERAVADVCTCAVAPFFQRHVFSSTRIDAGRYLAALGLRVVQTTERARSAAGDIERDLRIRAWQPTPSDTLRIFLWNPQSIWARAGLNTNDRVLSINGVAVGSWPEFRAQISAAALGAPLRFEIVRNGTPLTVDVVMGGFTRSNVTIEEVAQPTSRQLRLRHAWLRGLPTGASATR